MLHNLIGPFKIYCKHTKDYFFLMFASFFIVTQRGQYHWNALLFKTTTKMRSFERCSDHWLLGIRSSSHNKPVIMVCPYLSDCRYCSISCDNNLLEQSRKKQTLKTCCSPITCLSPFGWLILSESKEIATVFLSKGGGGSLSPLTMMVITPTVWPQAQNPRKTISDETRCVFCRYHKVKYSKATLQNVYVCMRGFVATMFYLTVKPKSTSAFVFVRIR